MSTSITQHDSNLEGLLSDYVALCNRVIAENKDNFWVRQAQRVNRHLWGGANFRTLVYDENPRAPAAEFMLHFDPDAQVLRLLPPGEQAAAFTWKASVPYLRDVAQERPDLYLEHPLMLDWSWLKTRVSDEVAHVDGRSLAAGFVLGAATAALAAFALSRPGTRE